MKKYIYRLGFICFLMYVPGVLLGLYRLWPCRNQHYFKEELFQNFNPWLWLKDWAGLLEYIPLGNLPMIAVFIPVFYLLWRWFKKPGWITAILLFCAFILLNPLYGPQDRLLAYLLDQAPLLQSLQ